MRGKPGPQYLYNGHWGTIYANQGQWVCNWRDEETGKRCYEYIGMVKTTPDPRPSLPCRMPESKAGQKLHTNARITTAAYKKLQELSEATDTPMSSILGNLVNDAYRRHFSQ